MRGLAVGWGCIGSNKCAVGTIHWHLCKHTASPVFVKESGIKMCGFIYYVSDSVQESGHTEVRYQSNKPSIASLIL